MAQATRAARAFRRAEANAKSVAQRVRATKVRMDQLAAQITQLVDRKVFKQLYFKKKKKLAC